MNSILKAPVLEARFTASSAILRLVSKTTLIWAWFLVTKL